MPLSGATSSTYPGGSTPGVFPDNVDVQVTVRGGNVAVGDVVMLDLTASDAATTTATRGGAASIFANVVPVDAKAVTGVGNRLPALAVCLTVALDDATCMVRTQGLVSAFVIKASGNIAIGEPLTVSTSANCTADGAEGDVIYAIAAAAATAPTTRTLSSVYFDGSGLGIKGTGSVMTTGGTQTVTGKTLTAPTLTTPTMSSPVITGPLAMGTAAAAGSAVTLTNIKTAIADAATANLFVVTVPNGIHGAYVSLHIMGTLGDGDATTSKYVVVAISRITGAAAKAAITAGTGVTLASIVGATGNMTLVAATSVAGGVGADNTVTLTCSAARTAGASTNHVIVAHATLLNGFATGCTIAAA